MARKSIGSNPSPEDLANLLTRFVFRLNEQLKSKKYSSMLAVLNKEKDAVPIISASPTTGNVGIEFIDVTNERAAALQGELATWQKAFGLKDLVMRRKDVSPNHTHVFVEMLPLLQEPQKFEKLVSTLERRSFMKSAVIGTTAAVAGAAMTYDGIAAGTDALTRTSKYPDIKPALPFVASDTRTHDPSRKREIAIDATEFAVGLAGAAAGGMSVFLAKDLTSGDPKMLGNYSPGVEGLYENLVRQLRQMDLNTGRVDPGRLR